MRFAVQPLRIRGRVIPRRSVVNGTRIVGELRGEEVRDAELGRYVQTATFVATDWRGTNAPLLPALLDVRIVAMSPLAFTLAGFERIDDIEYAQSWLVGPA